MISVQGTKTFSLSRRQPRLLIDSLCDRVYHLKSYLSSHAFIAISTLGRRSRRIIFMAVLIASIVVLSSTFYYLVVLKPVPLTENDGKSTYLLKGSFTHINNTQAVTYMNATKATTSISTANYQNSSFSIEITGYVYSFKPVGACFDFWLTVCGNLTPNLHPKSLVLSQSISYYSALNTSNLPRTSAYSNWYTKDRTNLTNLSRPSSEDNFIFLSLLKSGSVSFFLNFVNDTHLPRSSLYHFAVTNQSRSTWSYPLIQNSFCFYPNSYNITYYTNFTASLTGLSQPVSAQVDLILEND